MATNIIELAPIPKDVYFPKYQETCMCNINDYEFIHATGGEITSNNAGIYKYSIHLNKWELFIKYPDDCKLNYNPYYSSYRDGQPLENITSLYSKKTNKIYLRTNFPMFTIVDIPTKKFESHSKNNMYSASQNEGLLDVNGTIHIIKPRNGEHFTWDEQNKEFKVVRKQILDESQNESEYDEVSKLCWECGTTIYVPNKNIILAFGGMDSGGGDSWLFYDVWKCSLDYCDNLLKVKWESIDDLSIGMTWPIAALTADNQYVVISCGFTATSDDDCLLEESLICVLDMTDDNEFKFRKTTIKAPIFGKTHQILRTGNKHMSDLIVTGYVKKYSKFINEQFVGSAMPICIVKLIQEFYSQELIHWIDGEKHIAIPVKHILSSIVSN
eukprot:111873_1